MKTTWTRAAARAFALTSALALATAVTPQTFAQTPAHMHAPAASQELTPDQTDLLNIVRNATEKYKNVDAAKAAGYQLTFGCVTGDDFGAMGLHYLKGEYAMNPPTLKDGTIDPTRPQIVIYEPVPGGGQKLIGADFLLFADAWDSKHPNDPPRLKGQLFHYFGSPNRFGLPPFYTLHVWAWKENSLGAFVNWHPDVSCKSYVGDSN